MALILVLCPCCKKDQVIKRGKTPDGKQRYCCTEPNCPQQSFILDYSHRGWLPDIKEQIIDMTMNGSGIRDTARVLNISPVTVINEIKKKESCLESINRKLLEGLEPDSVLVDIQRVESAELDEMWSYVGNKGNQRWLWHAIDHNTGKVLAYVFGNRKDIVFLKLKALLEPFRITRFYTDDWGAYERHIPAEQRLLVNKISKK